MDEQMFLGIMQAYKGLKECFGNKQFENENDRRYVLKVIDLHEQLAIVKRDLEIEKEKKYIDNEQLSK